MYLLPSWSHDLIINDSDHHLRTAFYIYYLSDNYLFIWQRWKKKSKIKIQEGTKYFLTIRRFESSFVTKFSKEHFYFIHLLLISIVSTTTHNFCRFLRFIVKPLLHTVQESGRAKVYAAPQPPPTANANFPWEEVEDFSSQYSEPNGLHRSSKTTLF